jgi:regulator of RNase E activity RraA
MAGVLTDARLRDFVEIIELGLVAYCRGETVLAVRAELMPYEAGVPVTIDGVAVAPGDWIYGDGSGLVVIPGGEVRAILDAALEREDADAAEAARIRAEYGVEEDDLDLET